MRSREFLYETITIISEKTSSDEIIQYLEPLGFETKKISGFTTKVLVPASQRYEVVRSIQDILPDAEVSGDGKQVKYDGATILVKPSEAQGGRLEKEEGQIIALDSAIKERLRGQPSLRLLVGQRMVDAAGVEKIPGNVKADAAIVDSSGTQVAWISLKDGNSPKGFGQWGGVSHLSRDPEVADFIKKLQTVVGTEMPRGPTYGMEITSIDLKNAVVFGKNFQSGQTGPSNVDLVLQGHPTLEKGPEGSYKLTGAHTWQNGDVPSEQYDPVLTVRFSADRIDFGIHGARITAYPKAGRAWKPLNPDYEKIVRQQQPKTAEPKSIQNMNKAQGQAKIPMGQEPTAGQFNQNVALKTSQIPMGSA